MASHGARPQGIRNRSIVPGQLTDQQVLEARALYELKLWTIQRVIDRFPSVNPTTMRRILDYTNRSRLVPKESDIPEDCR